MLLDALELSVEDIHVQGRQNPATAIEESKRLQIKSMLKQTILGSN